MAKPLVTDALWERIQPLIPPRPEPKRPDRPGRPPLDDRTALTGILFVLKTGINWEDLPCEMGCGCGMTCWRRLRDWTEAGVWPKLHEILLAELHGADRIDWSRAIIDSSFVRARGGGGKTGPSPVDRRKKGSKHTIITDAGGVPLAATTTAANVPDVVPMLGLVDAIPPVRGQPGRPRRRPRSLYGDRGFDAEPKRRQLRRRGIRPFLARRRTEHGSGLGKIRWVVERTLSWLHNYGRLRIRKDREPAIHQAFLTLACAMICLNSLSRSQFC
jgi:transposase